ncbi:energy transducer TonB [Azovibrio restrictus]|uniref:energy transducer TonB n=1 Tax=Azovibrio restrictus TaxID=146938 RepID=UPI0026E97304|nr:TonB family protein [Azovibrio restrictus]
MLRRPAFLARFSTLELALAFSFVLHGLLLSLHFGFPDAARKLQNQALDVILVNSRSASKPSDPQALAQANLDGGGNTDQDRRAATPLPPTRKNQSGDQLEQMQRRVQELEARQRELLAQASQARTRPQEQAAEPLPKTAAATGFDLAEAARAMARMEGEISKNTEEYNKRPRKKFVGARTSEYRFAQYIEDWRQKVERVGTLNYPEAARGKLYGTLVLTVTLNREGEVLLVSIDRSSGHKVLDDAARRIVQLAAPYAPFPPAIREDTDQLVITRAWTFTRSDSLETR